MSFKQLLQRLESFLQWPQHGGEKDFLPAALELIESPASPAGRAVAASISGFVLVAILWASFGSVDIIATARGKIIPSGRTKIIQPMETGVVRSIHVQDGQQVKAGDVLVEIDATINEAERDRLHNEYIVIQLETARLRAVLAQGDNALEAFAPPEEATLQQLEIQKALLLNQIESRRAKLAALDKQILQNEANQAAIAATINKLQQSIPLLSQRSKVRNYLNGQGYGSKLDALTTQQDLVEHEQELNVQQSRLAEAAATVASFKEQRQEAEAEFKRTVLNDLAQAEQKGASLHEQWVQATQKSRLQTLTAPVDGTVQQLAVHTEGGVVTPAQALLAIVPADNQLEIDAMIANRDIGFVTAGQEAAIKIDTFNFTKYGLLHGHVVTVSQDAVLRSKGGDQAADKENNGQASNDSAGQDYAFAIHVALDETTMQIDDKRVNLSPGMTVTVEIKTGKRRLIEYLLSPLAKHQQEAMHER